MGRRTARSDRARPAASSCRTTSGRTADTVGDEDGHLAGLGVHLRGAAAEVGHQLGGADGGVGGGQAELEAVAADLCLELIGGAVGEDAAAVDDHDLVGELVGFLQVLGGEQHSGAVVDKPTDGLPELVAAARVQAAAGLVQEQHLGVADQADGQVQAAAHAARPGAHRAIGCLGQLEPLQQLGGPAMGLGPVQVVEAAGHDQVLLAGEVVVDRGRLAGQADHLPHRGGLADHVEAGHPS